MRACIIARAGKIKISRQTCSITDDPFPTNVGTRARQMGKVERYINEKKGTPRSRDVAKGVHDEKGRYILSMVISILHEWRRGGRERGREREKYNPRGICARELRESRWEHGCARAARSRRRPRIHIQIELYALPDALIRNHSTAWYLENKPVSSSIPPPSPRAAPLAPSPCEFPLYGIVVLHPD